MIEKYLSNTYQVLDDISTMTPYGGVRAPSEVSILILLRKKVFHRSFMKNTKKSITMHRLRLRGKFLLLTNTDLVSPVLA